MISPTLLKRPHRDWQSEGVNPDYRFSLANERTFLAWSRTALAVLAGGILLQQFATRLEPRAVIAGLSIGSATLAAVLGGAAYWRWKHNEIAMRHSQPLPISPLIPLLSASVFALAVTSAVLLYVQ
jgi:putative membrane protein